MFLLVLGMSMLAFANWFLTIICFVCWTIWIKSHLHKLVLATIYYVFSCCNAFYNINHRLCIHLSQKCISLDITFHYKINYVANLIEIDLMSCTVTRYTGICSWGIICLLLIIGLFCTLWYRIIRSDAEIELCIVTMKYNNN